MHLPGAVDADAKLRRSERITSPIRKACRDSKTKVLEWSPRVAWKVDTTGLSIDPQIQRLIETWQNVNDEARNTLWSDQVNIGDAAAHRLVFHNDQQFRLWVTIKHDERKLMPETIRHTSSNYDELLDASRQDGTWTPDLPNMLRDLVSAMIDDCSRYFDQEEAGLRIRLQRCLSKLLAARYDMEMLSHDLKDNSYSVQHRVLPVVEHLFTQTDYYCDLITERFGTQARTDVSIQYAGDDRERILDQIRSTPNESEGRLRVGREIAEIRRRAFRRLCADLNDIDAEINCLNRQIDHQLSSSDPGHDLESSNLAKSVRRVLDRILDSSRRSLRYADEQFIRFARSKAWIVLG